MESFSTFQYHHGLKKQGLNNSLVLQTGVSLSHCMKYLTVQCNVSGLLGSLSILWGGGGGRSLAM